MGCAQLYARRRTGTQITSNLVSEILYIIRQNVPLKKILYFELVFTIHVCLLSGICLPLDVHSQSVVRRCTSHVIISPVGLSEVALTSGRFDRKKFWV